MVNPRYRPFNGNSRKPGAKKPEVKLSDTKTDFPADDSSKMY